MKNCSKEKTVTRGREKEGTKQPYHDAQNCVCHKLIIYEDYVDVTCFVSHPCSQEKDPNLGKDYCLWNIIAWNSWKLFFYVCICCRWFVPLAA